MWLAFERDDIEMDLMIYLVMMMVILGPMGRVIARAQFEHMRECRYEEEQQLEEQFLRGTNAE